MNSELRDAHDFGGKRMARLAQRSESSYSQGLHWMNMREIKDSRAFLELIRILSIDF
jgi:cytidylate kinase